MTALLFVNKRVEWLLIVIIYCLVTITMINMGIDFDFIYLSL